MTTGIPDSLERLSHTDLIGVVRELIGDKPGGLTDAEEVEFSKLDALFKDLARWEELLWKECLNGPLTEEEAREYAELNARLPSHPSSNEVQDDYEDIFGGYAEVLKSIQSAG